MTRTYTAAALVVGGALLGLLLAGCGRHPASEPLASAADDTAAEHALKHTQASYHCPMHPEVVSDKPGKCPICGMTLVPAAQSSSVTSTPSAVPGEIRISPAVINNLGVRTEPALQGVLTRRLEALGSVGFDERRTLQVRSRTEGWVEGLSVRSVGDSVQAGQVLFRLRSPQLEAAQQEYLDAIRIGNRELIDASRERLRVLGLDAATVSELVRSNRRAGQVSYRAPVAGVVTALDVREGSRLTPDMAALTITGTGSLWVMAEVPEAQSAGLGIGAVAEIRFPVLPGEVYTGRIDYIYPELNAQSRTVRARITLDTPPAAVRANMLASISLQGGAGSETVYIPRSALIRSGREDRVVVALGDGRFVPRKVTVGAESGERIAIRNGLAAGERVVVAGQFLLDSEANLRGGLERFDATAPPAGAGRAQP